MGRKSDSTQINDLKTKNFGPLLDPEKIAECLNIQFINVGPKLASEISTVECDVKPVDSQQRVNSLFHLKEVTISDVFKKLREVNVAKDTGHDNIRNKILKIAAPVISKLLADLFNLSITTNTFPDDWKVAKVLPLFQSGERNDPNNFRSISVLPTVARVFERLIYEQMYTYFSENNLIQPRQSRFRSLHATVTAPLDMTNQWCFNIDRGMVSDVIFLDLKKAFDPVDHSILFKKTV